MTVPTGIITIWNDVVETIPSGWQICDGTNDTPDLRSKFVYGALNDAEVNATGGALTHSHTSIGLASGGAHSHSISGTTGGASSTAGIAVSSGGSSVTSSHTHTFSGSTSTLGEHSHTVGDADAASSIPAYVMLFYIMKL